MCFCCCYRFHQNQSIIDKIIIINNYEKLLFQIIVYHDNQFYVIDMYGPALCEYIKEISDKSIYRIKCIQNNDLIYTNSIELEGLCSYTNSIVDH